MNARTRTPLRLAQTALILVLALSTYFGLRLWWGSEASAHALPEFAQRTGEPCGTCHVNPGGGGPRTLRGLLWAAQGRPDDVPELPGNLIPPSITDGLELYDIACAGCHGSSGEGLYAINLAESGISRAAARSFIRDGIAEFGMPAFRDQLTDDQLESLAAFVAELGQGAPLPFEYPLPQPEFTCAPATGAPCGGD
jgi:Cytochrome C oxidase, cbb3-type, subunit III